MSSANKTNIVLIGMMGTFKSSAGKKIAAELDMRYVDTDELLEFDNSMSIAEMFSRFGEDFFREMERRTVKRASLFDNVVISTGGGVPLREDNMLSLAEGGYIVLLTASADAIYSRIKGKSTRPLAKDKESIVRLLGEREECYKRFAEIVVDNTELTSEQTAERVLAALRERLSQD